jgi:23S rRNA pseudouridine1911/1915/1917 synthase
MGQYSESDDRIRGRTVEAISREAEIPLELAGSRLDQAAARLLPEFSRTRLKHWIERGELTIEGRPCAPRTPVQAGQRLRLAAVPAVVSEVRPQAIPLELRYEDRDVFVVDKPAGLVVHPGAGNPDRTLQNALLALDPALALLPRAGLVHRLDKDTSGLLLVARTPAAQTALTAQLGRREVHRGYRAVCCGVLTGGGQVDAPIGRHPRDRLKMAVLESGRPAVTHYRVRERFRAHTYIDVVLETGRTHQIRVHLAHLRAPLVGDPLYGGRPRLPAQPSPELIEQLRGFRRQALHAARLEFQHPRSAAPVEVESPLPADFDALLAALRRDAARPA